MFANIIGESTMMYYEHYVVPSPYIRVITGFREVSSVLLVISDAA